jgi:CDP-diacylglycerol---serine O-phosphatidyltransferase
VTEARRLPRFSPADVVTAANGLCGFLALLVLAGLWIVPPGEGLAHKELVACLTLYGIGMVCDVVDGPIAHRFGSSGLGTYLDTISDTITFGLLPAALLVARLQEDDGWMAVALIVACLYTLATMLRLARNAWLEHARAASAPGAPQPEFHGMPSPVGGNCVLAIVVLAPAPLLSAAVVVIVSVLLVANFPYPNNKTVVGTTYVAALLVLSFAALAGLISLKVPSVVALVGLLPIAVVRALQTVFRD